MWQVQWRAIYTRVKALLQPAGFVIQAAGSNNNNQAGIGAPAVIENIEGVIDAIRELGQSHGSDLPCLAAERIRRLILDYETSRGASPNAALRVQAEIIMLSSACAEIEYLLSDLEHVGHTLVIRAFTHLQRLLVSDVRFREAWSDAYNQSGETACEQLGACHLLWHGIWAFKADASTGGRTDLVLGQPLQISTREREAAEVLVLTEWKRVDDPKDTDEMARQALKQAKLYTERVLAGFELSSRRFLVLVSETEIQIPPQIVASGLTYEYLNVAVKPSTPSALSKKRP